MEQSPESTIVLSKYQPRYLAFCREHGKTPEEMILIERKHYPGGSFCGFMFWIDEKWQKFYDTHPQFERNYPSEECYRQFDEWLNTTIT
jgi:hypothetical protein